MRWIHRELAAVLFVPALLVSACAGPVVSDAYTIENEPSKVEPIEGSEHGRVILTEQAAKRLAVQTVPVAGSAAGLVVPSSAVFVDPEGAWWVYTNPEPLVFVRHEIQLKQDDAGRAILASGPPPGTKVVTVGVPELSGVEDEIGH
jgi:hypothetical protein